MIRVVVLLAVFALTMTRVNAQGEHGGVYVVALSGTWTVGPDRLLRALAAIPARAEEIKRDAEYGSETDSLVLRDSRTLGVASIRCSPASRCSRPIRISSLQFTATPAVARLPRAASQRLFIRLGGDELASRVKLAGARGDSRNLGVLLLPIRGSAVDVAEVKSALAGESGRELVAKFCPLAGGSGEDFESCVEDREIRPGDCTLGQGSTCASAGISTGPVAVRLDVYARERSMLSTLAVASGFAVLVPSSDLASVTAQRQQIMSMIDSIGPELGAAELRALGAAAALELAAGR